MDAMLHIGADPKTVDSVKSSIIEIFDSAKDNRVDDKTIRKALEVLGRSTDCSHTTITNCTFENFTKD